jgi:hypothetical protein
MASTYSKGKKSFLSKAELEAFLATAVCPVMKNVRLTKELRLRKVLARGLSLGALFMQVGAMTRQTLNG